MFGFMIVVGCGKEKIKHWEEVFFQFDMPFKIEPGAETIHVGDTLTISASISDSLFDLFSNKKYYLPDFYFPVSLVTKELVDTSKYFPSQPGANNKFNYIFPIGNGAVSSISFADLIPIYNGRMYNYNCKLVPQQPGVYAIWFMDVVPKRILPQEFAPEPSGWRRVPIVRWNRYIINNGETHFSLLEQYSKPSGESTCTGCGVLSQKNVCYTFRVVP
ncbi:MAG TPA: hypothetical protein VFM18_07325 [Methanosarcina sp.]|nr:hypothetical protein [Methanosarcina sp.]